MIASIVVALLLVSQIAYARPASEQVDIYIVRDKEIYSLSMKRKRKEKGFTDCLCSTHHQTGRKREREKEKLKEIYR